jgi:hypothetical protein
LGKVFRVRLHCKEVFDLLWKEELEAHVCVPVAELVVVELVERS